MSRQICCAIKLSDKVAQLCCVSDIGLNSAAGFHSLPPGGAIGLALQTLSAVKSEFTPLYPAEVERLIQQMPAKTSPFDAVPVLLLKQCTTEMAVVIADLANVSFTTNIPRDRNITVISCLDYP